MAEPTEKFDTLKMEITSTLDDKNLMRLFETATDLERFNIAAQLSMLVSLNHMTTLLAGMAKQQQQVPK